ncbi:MAG TPA: hypothetical protein VHG28_22745 [Longimicrobiaceae bacterium]|nr:hypothetical protein [Longimicrobiaceae bacterium]
MSNNAHEHVTVSKDGYEVTFHPAFSSRCVVRSNSENGSETELYRQQEKHLFKNGEKHPKQHTIRIRGGQHNRDLELVVNDPKHQIARITVELYADGHEPGWGSDDEMVETFVVDNNSVSCPPNC